MKIFKLVRDEHVRGQGIEFNNGIVYVEWNGDDLFLSFPSIDIVKERYPQHEVVWDFDKLDQLIELVEKFVYPQKTVDINKTYTWTYEPNVCLSSYKDRTIAALQQALKEIQAPNREWLAAELYDKGIRAWCANG